MDIFPPQHDLPMLLFTHGGAWTHGTKGRCGFMAPQLGVFGGHSAGGRIAALMALHKDSLAQSGMSTDAIKGCFCLATTRNAA
jgi:acetyl esterase/lipase